MASQKALFLESVHGEWVVRDKPVPKALPGHVVVKNLATALNPVEWKVREFGIDMFVKEYPTVLGIDAAGTIEEVGKDVMQWKKGDRVLYQGYYGPDKNTFQQYTLVPAGIVCAIPDGLSIESASTIPTGVLTAAAGLYQYKGTDTSPTFTPPWLTGGQGKYAGEPIVILGGSSSVGQYAIQLAKLSGFSPIITTASLHNESLLLSFGATHVIDRSSPTLANDILVKLTSLNVGNLNIVFDTISMPSTQAVGLAVLVKGGAISVLIKPEVAEKAKADGKHVLHVTASAHMPHLRDFSCIMFATLPKLLEEGKIKPNAYKALPDGLDGVKDGVQLLYENKVSAMKLIALPFDTK